MTAQPSELTREERRELFLVAAERVLERGLSGQLGADVRRQMHDALRESARAAWFDVLAGATISLPQARGVDDRRPAAMHGAAFDPDDDPDVSAPLTDEERAEADRARAWAREQVERMHGGGER